MEDIFLRFLHLGVARSHRAEVAGADDRGAFAETNAEAPEAAETAVPRPLQVPRPVP